MMPRTIAIDGPAGSGKSVIGVWLAQLLGYAYLDTGVLYRAATWLAVRDGIPFDDGASLARAIGQAEIQVVPPRDPDDARGYAVVIDDDDVTEQLFDGTVNQQVSIVAAQPAVRAALLPVQRRIAAAGHVVMTGRDIGTVVMPNAEIKLYLDASIEERARRRFMQEQNAGGKRSLEAVTADVRQRDELDSTRATAPLRPAVDAILLHTGGMSLEDEKQRILDLLDDASADGRA